MYSERHFLGFFFNTLFSFIMTELKSEVVCSYKMLYSDLVSEQFYGCYFDDLLLIDKPNQSHILLPMVNKFEHGMVIFPDISLKITTIDVCRKHTNTGQCVLISSHEYWPRKIAWVRALLGQASHIQLFQERLSYKSVKAYATKSKGIIGNVDQRLLD